MAGSDTDDTNNNRDQGFSKAEQELKNAITEFKDNYERFAAKHSLCLIDEEGIRTAIQSADSVADIRKSAGFFMGEISKVIRLTKEKQKDFDAKWSGTISNFLSKLYPLTRLSLSLTSAICDVLSYLKIC